MANERSGNIAMTVDGKRFTGSYLLDGDILQVSTEIGTLRKHYKGGSLKHVAEQLLAKLVREELKNG
jgi:hypothetical protein